MKGVDYLSQIIKAHPLWLHELTQNLQARLVNGSGLNPYPTRTILD